MKYLKLIALYTMKLCMKFLKKYGDKYPYEECEYLVNDSINLLRRG